MTVATLIPARTARTSVGELAAARLAIAIERLEAFRAVSDVSWQPGWREDFAEWCDQSAEGHALGGALTQAQARLDGGSDGVTRRRLHALFRLDEPERDLLDCALAVEAVPDLLCRLGGTLNEQSVALLFGHPARPILRPTSALQRWGLLRHARNVIAIDRDIASLIEGRPGLDNVLANRAAVIEPPAFVLPSWPLADVASEALRLTEMGRVVRVVVGGLPGNGRQSFAAALAAELSSRLLRVSSEGAHEAEDLYMRAQRLALLTGHALYWDGDMPEHPAGVASAPLQFMAASPQSVPPPVEGLIDLWVDLPAPSRAEKAELWRALGHDRDGVDLGACGPAVGSARLSDILALAEYAPRKPLDARNFLARRIRSRIEGSGNLLPLPYERSDLVLTPATAAQIDTILGELAARDRLLARPRLATHYGRLGQSILFHGESGLGKTMCAQVLARELGADLVRIDCASIVSKFIGETVKQMRALFGRLHGTGAVAVFDEADSLFAKRTDLKDSNDRHANADTNYLLQLIEEFDGIAILATNRKDNMDPAFLRRMRFVVEFTDLGRDGRGALWNRHLDALSGAGLTAGWGERLALAELTPAQIKGAALSGYFIGDARGGGEPLLADFLAGIERELAKDSRTLDPALRRRIADG